MPRIAAVAPETAGLRAGPRDPVAERYLPHLASSWRVAVVLAVEPTGVSPRLAIGALAAAGFDALSVSLTVPSLLRSVIEARRPHVGHAVDPSGAPRERWLTGLVGAGDNELAVAPVIVADRVLRVLIAVGARQDIGGAAGEVIRVARTMVDAYQRVLEARER